MKDIKITFTGLGAILVMIGLCLGSISFIMDITCWILDKVIK